MSEVAAKAEVVRMTRSSQFGPRRKSRDVSDLRLDPEGSSEIAAVVSYIRNAEAFGTGGERK
jgi:hypothetical protein